MGAAVIDWIAYGSAARMLKGATDTFGKGDVRGLIAAEFANNAREGGALIPTLAFGVPGAPSMALLMGAFLAHGIAPGPKLLDTQLDLTYTMIWTLALANVAGAGICFLSANPLARIATLRSGILIPTVFAVCFVGAFQGTKSYGDLVTLVVFGITGWFMKRHGWARAPLILGFVLGKLIEKYLFISLQRYQFTWLERPGVIVILTITALVLLWPIASALYRQWLRRRAVDGARTRLSRRFCRLCRAFFSLPPCGEGRGGGSGAFGTEGPHLPTPTPDPSPHWGGEQTENGETPRVNIDTVVGAGLWVLIFLGFAAAFWSASGWRLSARLMPQTAAATGLIVIAIAAIAALVTKLQGVARTAAPSGEHSPAAQLSPPTVYARLGVEALWLIGFLVGVALIGLMPSMGVYMFAYMATAGRTRWTTALIITAALWIGFYILFDRLLHIPWPPSLLGDMFPDLRELAGRLI